MLAVIIANICSIAMLVGLLAGIVAGVVAARGAVAAALTFDALAGVTPRTPDLPRLRPA